MTYRPPVGIFLLRDRPARAGARPEIWTVRRTQIPCEVVDEVLEVVLENNAFTTLTSAAPCAPERP